MTLFKGYILIPCAFLVLALSVNAQQPSLRSPDCSTISRAPSKSKKSIKIVSFGVLNAKALNLVRPHFPTTARSAGVRGLVELAILIDEFGCVVEAKKISGHPALIASSLEAAKRTTFLPPTIGGNRVRASGVITYQYRLNSMNWLELGFNSNSSMDLIEFLPKALDAERKLLEQAQTKPYSERQLVLDEVLPMITIRLENEPKNLWLFTIGRHLRALKTHGWNLDGRNRVYREIVTLLETTPINVPSQLVTELGALANLVDTQEFRQRLKQLEDKLFDLGN